MFPISKAFIIDILRIFKTAGETFIYRVYIEGTEEPSKNHVICYFPVTNLHRPWYLCSIPTQICTVGNVRMRVRTYGNIQILPQSLFTHTCTPSGQHNNKKRATLARTASLKKTPASKRQSSHQMSYR